MSDDDSKYVDRWNGHIDELTRLGWYLEEADRDRVGELKDELREIVGVADTNRTREDAAESARDAEYVTHT